MGILLIISAGSFIYVATLHILPEVLNEGTGDHHGHSHGDKGEKYSKAVQLAAMVAGLVAPIGLTFLEDA